MKRRWVRGALIVALLVSAVTLSFSVLSYVRKAVILVKARNPQLAIVGDIADSEEYAVYSAIIESRLVDPSTELVLIEGQTGLGLLQTTELRKPWGFELSDEVWDDFSAKNGGSSTCGNSFTLSNPYLLVNSSDLVDVNMEFWGVNIRRTPFLEFSRVGFNSQKDEAVVHLGVTLLGHTLPATAFSYGQYLWLKKVDGVWKIQEEQDTYIT